MGKKFVYLGFISSVVLEKCMNCVLQDFKMGRAYKGENGKDKEMNFIPRVTNISNGKENNYNKIQ